jgi:hypothetical protein
VARLPSSLVVTIFLHHIPSLLQKKSIAGMGNGFIRSERPLAPAATPAQAGID